MDTLGAMLADSGRAGVYHLTREAREVADAAQGAGLACFRIDIGRAAVEERRQARSVVLGDELRDRAASLQET